MQSENVHRIGIAMVLSTLMQSSQLSEAALARQAGACQLPAAIIAAPSSSCCCCRGGPAGAAAGCAQPPEPACPSCCRQRLLRRAHRHWRRGQSPCTGTA